MTGSVRYERSPKRFPSVKISNILVTYLIILTLSILLSIYSREHEIVELDPIRYHG